MNTSFARVLQAIPPRIAGLELAIIGMAALALWTMGRTVFCRCGTVALWSGNVWSNQNSQQLADPYSVTHGTHGVLFFWIFAYVTPKLSLGVRLLLATFLEASWEVTENTDWVINRYREVTMSLDYYGDSVLNSTGDILSFVLGFALAARFPWQFVLAGVVLSELALTFIIRDSLLLNVIMLVYPLDAIRAWQMEGAPVP